MEIKRICVLKNFDETVRLQSERREEWIREIREERLQGIAEGDSTAPRPASSSAAPLPGSNECPGNHRSPTEQEEREDSSRQRDRGRRKDEGEDRAVRTEQEPAKRRREEADSPTLPRPSKSVQNGAGFSRET